MHFFILPATRSDLHLAGRKMWWTWDHLHKKVGRMTQKYILYQLSIFNNDWNQFFIPHLSDKEEKQSGSCNERQDNWFFPPFSFDGALFRRSVCVCVCIPVIVFYIGLSVRASACLNLGSHTLRSRSFVPYLYPLNVTSTTWLLSPGDKIPSCKDGSCPTFQKRPLLAIQQS